VARVYIVRHAVAEERDAARWPDDSLRPLTATGTERFRSAARGLARLVPGVDAVLSSGYVRAWDTATLLTEEIGWPGAEDCPPLEGPRDPADAAGLLAGRAEETLALVGHEPHLSGLASLLLTGRPGLAMQLKKGGVVALGFHARPEQGAGELLWSLTPKTLRLLGG